MPGTSFAGNVYHSENCMSEQKEIPLEQLYGSGGWDAIMETNLSMKTIIEYRDEYGYSLLHEAAGTGDAKTVGLLLSKRADPNARGYRKVTPLHSYAEGTESEVECCRLLVLAGANVDARDNFGLTPLMVAARWGKIVPVVCLLALGANPILKSRKGLNARDLAASTLEYVPKTLKFKSQREELRLTLDVLHLEF